jgi:hypothetical protein
VSNHSDEPVSRLTSFRRKMTEIWPRPSVERIVKTIDQFCGSKVQHQILLDVPEYFEQLLRR